MVACAAACHSGEALETSALLLISCKRNKKKRAIFFANKNWHRITGFASLFLAGHCNLFFLEKIKSGCAECMLQKVLDQQQEGLTSGFWDGLFIVVAQSAGSGHSKKKPEITFKSGRSSYWGSSRGLCRDPLPAPWHRAPEGAAGRDGSRGGRATANGK